MYEESLRIPLLMRYPALVKPRTVVSDMVLNIDLAPTFLELAGAPIPASMQGRSWAPLFHDGHSELRTSFFYEYFPDPNLPGTPNIEGVRTSRWKYIRYPGANETDELYDLNTDPYEMHNLANDKAAAPQLELMKAAFERARRSVAI